MNPDKLLITNLAVKILAEKSYTVRRLTIVANLVGSDRGLSLLVLLITSAPTDSLTHTK